MVCKPRLLFAFLAFALVLGAAPVPPPYANLGTSAVNQTTEPAAVQFYLSSGTPATYTMAYGQEFAVDTSTCLISNSLYQCNVTFTPHAPGLRRDALLMLDSGGNLIYTKYLYGIGQGSVSVITPGIISTVSVPSPGLVFSGGSAYDPAGNLYVTDYGSGRIYKITTAGVVSVVSITGDIPTQPVGIVFNGAGSFYVSDNSANRIIKVAPDGTGTALTLSTALAHPVGLALDNNNNLYIANSGFNNIVKVNPYGSSSVLNVSTTINNPIALTLDLAGNLYIAQTYNGSIIKVTSGGSSSVLTPSIPLTAPAGLQTDPAGNLYAVDVNFGTNTGVNKVYRIAPDGTSTLIAGTGSSVDSGDGSAATSAGLNIPQWLALAPDGKLVVVERSAIRVISSPVVLPDFGNTNIGAMSTLQNVHVSNIGNQDASLSALSVTGDFLSDPSSTCNPGTPLTYASAGCTVVLGFIPTQAGARNGLLAITSGLQLSLTGTGIGTGGPVSTTSLGFGTVTTGSPSLPQTATITNSGTGALNIMSAVISGPNAIDFTLVNNCPSSLAPSANCTMSVTFQPSTTAGETATLTITYVDALTNVPVTQTIALSGTGVAGSSTGPLPSGPLHFVAVAPCRLADTRLAQGPFGGPHLTGGVKRDFSISSGACGIPANAEAYAMNVTVVPEQPEPSYVRAWAAGQAQPEAVVLNTEDGNTKGNATIVQAGTNGNISVWSEHDTQLVLDITGYFVPDVAQSSFHPLTPCRAVDTRGVQGPLGSPSLKGNTPRIFNLAGICNLPATASAYMLNFTVVPHETLSYLQAWSASSPQPGTSILNSVIGTTVANAAIIQPDANGQIEVYAKNDTDLVIDVAGYFASGSGGLSLYTVAPCRAFDTRTAVHALPLTGTQMVPMSGSACGATPNAQAYLFNTGVVPQEDSLAYLQLWADGGSQPPTSILNSVDGAITSNMAVVPTISGAVSAYTTNATHLVLDIYGYFAP